MAAPQIKRDIVLDDRVVDSLHCWRPTSPTDLILIPSRVRSNGVWYAEGDLETLKIARDEGLRVSFISDGPAKYLHEYSAGWYEELAIATASGLAAPALIAIAQVIRRKARGAVERGLHAGPPSSVPFTLTVTRIRRKGDETELASCKAEGSADDVIDGLATMVEHLGLDGSTTEGIDLQKPSVEHQSPGRTVDAPKRLSLPPEAGDALRSNDGETDPS